MLNNDSVEISGWGKFMFNRKRAEKYVIKLEQQIEMYKNEIERNDLTDRKRVIVQGKLNVLINNLELLKKKLQNEPK